MPTKKLTTHVVILPQASALREGASRASLEPTVALRSRSKSRFVRIELGVVLALAAPLGCFWNAGSADPPASVAAIGPAPLRRLTNEEYINALSDLFPSVAGAVALPPLPADATVAGFDNSADVQQPSDVLVARYESIANLYAEALTATPDGVASVVGCDPTGDLAEACGSSFVDAMGGRLFRRPLRGDEHDRFVARFAAWSRSVDFEGAVQLTLASMLQSPQFVYRAEPPPAIVPEGLTAIPVEPYAMASRLSFFLWKSVPDDELLAAAAQGQLSTTQQIRDQAARMLQDTRARRVLYSFHRQWLGLDRILQDEHNARSAAIDPTWSPATQASLSRETQLFIENVLGEGGSFRDLLSSRRAWLDAESARIYGVSAPDVPWTEVTLPVAERSGLFTRGAFLAAYSHRGATSPPVRGNWVQLRLLCQLPISPPPDADLSQPMSAPDDAPQTTRMLFETRTKPAACRGCHAGLNGFGFGFERYDAAGKLQNVENGLGIDARGKVIGTDVDGVFDGAVDLSARLSDSATVHACATERWLRFALGRAPTDGESHTVLDLAERFHASHGNVRSLLIDIVSADTFRLRPVEVSP